MNIDWKALQIPNATIDYYAYGIQNGNIINEKVYYKLNETENLHTENKAFDSLISNGLAKCFSRGFTSDNKYEKFDLHIQSDFAALIYDELEQSFPYFDISKAKEFKEVFWDSDIIPVNHIIGSKKNVATSEFESLCLYFKIGLENHNEELKNGLVDFAKSCNAYSGKAVFPVLERGCKLYIIALDYSENNFKLKYYFKFDKPLLEYSRYSKNPLDATCQSSWSEAVLADLRYDIYSDDYSHYIRNLLNNFSNTENHDIVSKILDCNGFVEGFQCAIDEKSKASYNFYIKEW